MYPNLDTSFTTGDRQENWGGRYGKSDRLEDVSGKRGAKGEGLAVAGANGTERYPKSFDNREPFIWSRVPKFESRSRRTTF